MYLEDILAGLSGAMKGGLDAYSWKQHVDEEEQKRRDRQNEIGLRQMSDDADRMYRTGRDRVSDQRYDDESRLRNAQVLAPLLTPGAELDQPTAASFEGTPYAPLVQQNRTLPSRSFPIPLEPRPSMDDISRPSGAGTGTLPLMSGEASDPGGRETQTWTGLPAQRQAATARVERDRVLGTLPIQARRAVEASEITGTKLTPADLATPEERAVAEAKASRDALSLHEGKARIDAKYRREPRGAQPGYQWVIRAGKQVWTNQVMPGDTPASRTGGGRNVTSGDASDIADFDTSLDDVNVLRNTIAPIDEKTGKPKNTGATGNAAKVGAMTPNWVTDLTGWGTDAKKKQAVIDRVKQVIGKTLEGGVLRKEDEYKYEKILPTIGDTGEVVRSKLDGLDAAVTKRRSRRLDALADAGYDVSKYQQRERVPNGQIVIEAPDGSKHPFATQAQADRFKQLAGLK